MGTSRTTACVVGGGPAGMVLGLLLARAGVEVVVLEKHADFLRDFRGDTVHPPTLDLLDDLGLGQAFRALPQRRVEQVQVPFRGGAFKVADLTALPGPNNFIAMVPQWDFLDLLATAGADEPTFTLRRNTEATALRWTGRRVTGVDYRTADGETGSVDAALVIACDGRGSRLRAEAHLVPKSYPTPMDVWWYRVPRHDSDPEGIVPVLGKRRAGVLIDRGDYWQIAAMIPKGSDPVERTKPVTDLMRDLAAVLPWLADRTGAVTSWDEVKTLDVKLDRLTRWHVDGLLCIGDAAHAMSPAGGVGINLAVQDAVAAARLLAGPLRAGAVSTSDLARVRRRRLLPTVVVQAVQRVIHAKALGPALAGEIDIADAGRPPLALRVLTRLRVLQWIPAQVIGRGVRTEPTPGFARR
ncbi:2-polyprenyl-6-methoxyphenol hydroxylase-like FAD-dependent oxidoreductase [Actinokineospora baliensis]|uniref:FAD-dependent oxidoreductase n=1 Tax=Actinokineospora baliensis TaxID=547056 RepID=UPI00195C3DE4|nr:FAD-dependent oxidoreductase [Actinokineospora baliensis]MBM7772762.1 2-polyprenyl-6-methoxyphenol hydroxylase-like FAD-dependent oxidoreductase [Actinokineospora baliensis]